MNVLLSEPPLIGLQVKNSKKVSYERHNHCLLKYATYK